MEIKSLLSEDCTNCAVSVSSKKRIIEYLGHLAAQHINDTSEQEITNALLSRERVGSTGIGQGIALPHGRLANIDKAIGVLITTSEPVDFDAIDNQPVNVFFALFVPEGENNQHLKSLAAIAQKLSDKSVLKRIRTAHNNQELYQAITD